MPFLYLTADRPGENAGGAVVVKNEYEALCSLGETALICRDQLEPEISKYGPEPWCWDLAAAELLRTKYKDVKFELCHGYAGTFSESVKILKERGTRASWMIAAHDIEVSKREHEKLGMQFNYPHLIELELWQRYIAGYKAADILICPGKAPYETLRKQGFEQRIEVIPHGCHISEKIEPLPNMYTLGYLGSMGIDKGLVYLLSAWKKLAYKDSLLIIAGKESTSSYFKAMVNQFGGGSIYLAGWQTDAHKFYSSLSLYVQPSATEGFGLEVLEAMSSGRAVLCSTGAGAADVVQVDAMRFKSCDVDSLANVIDNAKRNWDLEDTGRSCREIAQQYTWGKIQDRYREVWKETLKTPRTKITRKFAFDWGGSLENNESLRQIARDLYKIGHEVYIIPAAGGIPSDETYFSWLKDLDIPFTAFHRVLDIGLGPEHIAMCKVAKMRELGCHVLYDDNSYNLDAVRAAGLVAVEIKGNNLVPLPSELLTS